MLIADACMRPSRLSSTGTAILKNYFAHFFALQRCKEELTNLENSVRQQAVAIPCKRYNFIQVFVIYKLSMTSDYLTIILILLAGALISVLAKKLTWLAGLTGFVTGVLIYVGAGYTGITMLAAFFILGTVATSWGMDKKKQKGLAEKDYGRRTTGQVIANAGVAAIMGFLAIVKPENRTLFQLMMAASFSSATADTLSSEMGNVLGKRFYNILTFRKDKRGLDGVVSMEGTLWGVAGSICIAAIHAIGFGFGVNFYLIIIAGTIGNLSDSLLGATLERKHYLNNNTVNFLNTAIAAAVVCVVYFFNKS